MSSKEPVPIGAMRRVDLEQVLAPRPGYNSAMVGPFIFRCPATGLNVQHVFEDEVPEIGIERRYESVRCLACTGIHLIRRKTGRLISDDAKE